jgi:hypothetical protein
MAATQYLVTQQSGQWWITLHAMRTGPYATKADAIRWAVHTAKLFEKSGSAAEVAVDEPENGILTVYETGKAPRLPDMQ